MHTQRQFCRSLPKVTHAFSPDDQDLCFAYIGSPCASGLLVCCGPCLPLWPLPLPTPTLPQARLSYVHRHITYCTPHRASAHVPCRATARLCKKRTTLKQQGYGIRGRQDCPAGGWLTTRMTPRGTSCASPLALADMWAMPTPPRTWPRQRWAPPRTPRMS